MNKIDVSSFKHFVLIFLKKYNLDISDQLISDELIAELFNLLEIKEYNKG